jgi:hypothetical protein
MIHAPHTAIAGVTNEQVSIGIKCDAAERIVEFRFGCQSAVTAETTDARATPARAAARNGCDDPRRCVHASNAKVAVIRNEQIA